MIQYKSQEQFIAEYNRKYREAFNPALFKRKEEDIINAIKLIVYSCERESMFTIKVKDFQVIDDYDEIRRILWALEDAAINKNKSKDEAAGKKKSGGSKNINIYDYINLDESYIKLIKVTYYTKIEEKKNGVVDEIFDTYIAIPRIVDGIYFKINGTIYSAIYQIVDASTYNNSASKNAKKQSVTFKTVFTPFRIYRYNKTLVSINGEAIPSDYFIINVFRKSTLIIKYILAKFGLYDAIKFLCVDGINITDNVSLIDYNTTYIFPVRDMYITIPRYVYDKNSIAQSFVYTLHNIITYMKDQPIEEFLQRNVYIKALGAEFTTKNVDTILQKGYSLLDSLEFNYDLLTKEDLMLSDDDKGDVYKILRWLMYEFNALRRKDNLDISTKKVRYAEYIAYMYANKLAYGIYRISDKGSNADLSTIRKAINIAPMYLINAIIKSNLVNSRNCVNDLDSILALKYTFKGNTGIGEKSNAISNAYRSIHPSHMGRVDIDSSSNSDPGVSGTICPYVELHNGHFDEYQEPSSWRENISSIYDVARNIETKMEMCRLVDSVGIRTTSKQQINQDCLSVAYTIMDSMDAIKYADSRQYIDIYSEDDCIVIGSY